MGLPSNDVLDQACESGVPAPFAPGTMHAHAANSAARAPERHPAGRPQRCGFAALIPTDRGTVSTEERRHDNVLATETYQLHTTRSCSGAGTIVSAIPPRNRPPLCRRSCGSEPASGTFSVAARSKGSSRWTSTTSPSPSARWTKHWPRSSASRPGGRPPRGHPVGQGRRGHAADRQRALQLLEPTETESTVAKFIESRGEGLHHIAIRVDDIEATLAHLRKRGPSSSTSSHGSAAVVTASRSSIRRRRTGS